MRIAIPIANGELADHFGHCERFAFVDVEPSSKQILSTKEVEAPPHQPGLLPGWMRDHEVNVVIAGGMGARAQRLFAAVSITVLVGVPSDTVPALVERYLAGNLTSGANRCDH